MGLADLEGYLAILVCPRCGEGVEIEKDAVRCTNTGCAYSRAPFPLIADVPALLDFERSVVSVEDLTAGSDVPDVERRKSHSRLRSKINALINPPNDVAERNVGRMLRMLREGTPPKPPVVLVVGGGSIGSGMEELYSAKDIDVLSFDIYRSPFVQFMADAHAIPLADESVDGVIIEAVLEHVLEPRLVVEQIERVLRQDGIVYADTPFLQQVHQGAYDFTRFTDSGHRYLFRGFECIDSGVVKGPGMQLIWSIDYFVRALFRSARAGYLARVPFFWLNYIDRHLDERYAVDGASGVFFLGRKSGSRISPRDIIDYYQGSQLWRNG
jgi:SAM-dependent methyltransferase